MSEYTNKQQILTSLYRSGKRGFRTLSDVRRKELLSLLKSKNQEEELVKTSLVSSKESGKTMVSAFSPSRLMMLLVGLTRKIKLVSILIWARAIGGLLKIRNRTPQILVYPDPKLKRVAEPVDFKKISRKRLVKIVQRMGAALDSQKYGNKLGIAAPQIGIPLRIVTMDGAVMVNPTWNPSRSPKTSFVEGCYSSPGKLYSVSRAPYGWAEWYSIDGEKRHFKFNGTKAVVYQHELDHLDGVCCPDVGELIEK